MTGNAPSGTAEEVNLALFSSKFSHEGKGSPDCNVTSTADGVSVTSWLTSSGNPNEKPVPDTLDSGGILTATSPTVEVSGRSSKSTDNPLESPAALGAASPPPDPPPLELEDGAELPPLPESGAREELPPPSAGAGAGADPPLELGAGAGADPPPLDDVIGAGALPPPELGAGDELLGELPLAAGATGLELVPDNGAGDELDGTATGAEGPEERGLGARATICEGAEEPGTVGTGAEELGVIGSIGADPVEIGPVMGNTTLGVGLVNPASGALVIIVVSFKLAILETPEFSIIKAFVLIELMEASAVLCSKGLASTLRIPDKKVIS
mgnify:CR=1 FL=1